MSATAEKRLAGDPVQFADNAPAVGVAAVATFAAEVGIKHSVVAFSISSSLAPTAATRATLAFTKNGVAITLGFTFAAAAFAPIVVNFASHPIEGDANTAITLTMPAVATASHEVWMSGYKSAE